MQLTVHIILISMDLYNASCSFIKMVLILVKDSKTVKAVKCLRLLIKHSTGRVKELKNTVFDLKFKTFEKVHCELGR